MFATNKTFFARSMRQCLSTSNRSTYCKKVRVTPESNDVLIDYVTLYAQYVCQMDAQTCIANIILPPINEQYDIVKNYLSTLHELKHLHNLEGIVFRLCASHDNDALEAFKVSVNELNNANDIIQSIIEYVRDQPSISDISSS
jgi:hypothetical protein